MVDVLKFPRNRVEAQTAIRPPMNPWYSTINPDFRDLRAYYDALLQARQSDRWVGPPRFGTIAAGATATPVQVKITGYQFMIDSIIGTSDLPDWILVTIRDLSTGQALMNNPISITNLCGSGGQPAIQFVPRILENGSTLEFTLQNSHASTDSDYSEIAFHGVRKQVS